MSQPECLVVAGRHARRLVGLGIVDSGVHEHDQACQLGDLFLFCILLDRLLLRLNECVNQEPGNPKEPDDDTEEFERDTPQ